MTTYKRHYYPWTNSEILKLQREYDLLHLNIGQIAKNHNRSEMAIVYKLVSEGYINNKILNCLKKKYSTINSLTALRLIYDKHKKDPYLINEPSKNTHTYFC